MARHHLLTLAGIAAAVAGVVLALMDRPAAAIGLVAVAVAAMALQVGRLVDRSAERHQALLQRMSAIREELATQRRAAEQSESVLRSLVEGVAELRGADQQTREELSERLQGIGDASRSAADLARNERRTMIRDLQRLSHEPVREVDALMQLHRRFPFDGAVPLTGGWALSPRGLLQVIDLAQALDGGVVVECGSGTSTLYLAKALADSPTRLISLEHLPEIAEGVRDMLGRHGLAGRADVRHAPLVQTTLGDDRVMWYDMASLADVDRIDLLVVDGPPGSEPDARAPALEVFLPKLPAGALVVLDDARRRDERVAFERWMALGVAEEVWSTTKNQRVLRISGATTGDVPPQEPPGSFIQER